MSLNSIYANSLWWVQFRLQGGWRRHLALVAIYIAVVAGLTGAAYRLEPNLTTADVCQGWIMILSVLQGGILVLVGCSGIRRAVQRDYTTGMIESHRLTPMSGLTAAIGYLIGPNLQTLVLAGCNVVAGMIFSFVGGAKPAEWLMTMGMLFWVALVLWSIIALLALSTRGSVNLLMIGVLLLAPSASILLSLVPGVGLLVGLPFWTLTQKGLSVNLAGDSTLPTLLLQAGILATCITASARKYRRLDIRAFPPGLGLLLVLEVVLLGGFGMRLQENFPFGNQRAFSVFSPTQQLVALLTCGVAFGLFPLSFVAQNVAEEARTARQRRRHVVRLIGMTLAVAVVVVGTSWVLLDSLIRVRSPAVPVMWVRSLGWVVLALAPMGPWLWLIHRTGSRVAWFVLAWVFVFWFVPPVLDVVLAQLNPGFARPGFTWITAISPPGALAFTWQHPQVVIWPGIIVQTVVAVVTWTVFAVLGSNRVTSDE